MLAMKMKNETMPNQKGNTLLGIVIGVVLVIVIGGAYYFSTQKNVNQVNTSSSTPQNSASLVPQSTPSWLTYTSPVEKASFQYPTDWTKTTPLASNITGADMISLKSPSGEVSINWVSAIDGFGGGCDTEASLESGTGCPLNTVIEKDAIAGAPGLFVVLGMTTLEGKIYMPWLAVQDENGFLETKRSLSYLLFYGKNNKSLTGDVDKNTTALFTTAGVTANRPKLTQQDASAYFEKPDVKIAKEIMLSLQYTK